MALEAQNNPFTSILMVGAADPEALSGDADPSAGSYRLVMGTDDALYILDDAGVATPVAGASGAVATDAIWDAAGDLAVGSGANTAAKLTIGAAGSVLTSNGTTATWAPRLYSPDNYPTSGLTLSDEFDDSSLDGAWTWDSAPGGTVSESTYPGYLYLTGGTDSSATQRILRRAFVPGVAAFSVAAKCNLAMENGNFGGVFGIRLVDSSDATLWQVVIAADGTATASDGYRIISTVSTWITATLLPMVSAPQYLLITRSAANVYKGYISANGIVWQYLGTSTVATAVAKVCIAYGVDTDALDDDASIDFVRVFNTETKKIGA